MTHANDYRKQAADFLTLHSIEFRAVLIGSDCPAFCEDAEKGNDMDAVNTYPRRTHIHGKHYRCTFSRKGQGHFSVDFWNSYADEAHNAKDIFERPRNDRKRRMPTPYDVLACINKSDPGTFEDFCSEFGYSTDSIKAEKVYRAVVDEWRKFRLFFTSEQIQQAQEIA